MTPDGTTGRLLIISADDYGLTAGVCRGILAAHGEGALTSTSVLTVGTAFERWAGPLADSGLDAGVHLCAVGEDPPLLAATEVPTLVDRRGHFPLTWRTFLWRAMAGRVDPDDLRREFGAQIDAALAAGIDPSHVDTHQHLHLWPAVSAVLIGLCRNHQIRATRIPQAHGRSPRARAFTVLSQRLRRAVRDAGLAAPDEFLGHEEAGALDRQALLGLIERAGQGVGDAVELGCHPGEPDDPERNRFRWGYRWDQELAALRDPATRDAIRRAGLRTGSFADLPGVA